MIPLTGFSASPLLFHLTETSLSTFKTCCYVANTYLQSGKFQAWLKSLSSCDELTQPADLKRTPWATFPIDNLPADWLDHVSLPANIRWLRNCSDLNSFSWKESYISANSFSLNKRNYMSSHGLLYPSLSLDTRTKNSIHFIQKRHKSTFQFAGRRVPDSHLKSLEEYARANPSSASAQLVYLEAVWKEDPEHALRWYSRKCSQLNDRTLRLWYAGAKGKPDRDQSSSRDYSSHDPRPNQSSPPPITKINPSSPNMGTEDTPLYVRSVDANQEEDKRGAALKSLKTLGTRVLLLWVLYSLFRMFPSPSNMLGVNKEYLPEKPENQTVRFDDVQGCDEAKEELSEVVQFLQNPEKFKRLGAKIPCGVLLVGPPGTGKTLLARAIAGEAERPFFFVSGSEFDEMFVGVGASRIRKLFQNAKENAPSIIFIDELDAVGGKRNVTETNPYSRMTLNQLLVELDGFKENEGVIVVGATNFAEVLDTALTRPGRFDTRVHVALPDVRGRAEILNLYIKKENCTDDVDIDVLARSTPGFTGADLSNLVNQAALRAASLQLPLITMKHFDWARDKIIMGPERRSAVIDVSDRMVTAYHESGHAIVAMYTKDANPPLKATIIPRGNALGYVMRLPKNDELSRSKKQLLAEMDVCMGGRVAEELIFGEDNITTGASSDMQQASAAARAMVTQYGMSDKVGTVQIDERRDNVSPELRAVIESEVKRLVDESYARAKTLIQKHRKEHKLLAEGLLKYETLNDKEIDLVVKGKSFLIDEGKSL